MFNVLLRLKLIAFEKKKKAGETNNEVRVRKLVHYKDEL